MLKGKTLGLIHASSVSINMCKPFIDEYIPEVSVMHFADDTVQRDNLAAPLGELPKKNFSKFALYARLLQESGADMILLACSTFNQAVEFARPMIDIPIWQIDYPMIEKAVKSSERIGVLGTLPSAVLAEKRLINQVAEKEGKTIKISSEIQREAFDILLKGDSEKHNELLLKSIEKMASEVDCIVLAQISMAVLEPRTEKLDIPVYNSGRICFPALRDFLDTL